MSKLRLGVILAGCLITSLSVAEGDRLLATRELPALVTASRSVGTEAAEVPRAPRVIVGVTSYQPARDGAPVLIVVKARDKSGTERVIGSFGITPKDKAFKVPDPSRARRFHLPLPPGFSIDEPLKLNIYVEADDGTGRGAQVEIGGAELR